MPHPELHIRTVGVEATERSYWTVTKQPRGERVPLLVALHGLGMTGRHMALWTGLARRGPEAGFNVIFPNALERCWDDHGTGRRDGADDAAFIATLATHLRNRNEIGDQPVCLVGLSNGACFAERLAREAALDIAGIALVAGLARVASHDRTPLPPRPTAVFMLHGSADRLMPWAGGSSHWIWRRRALARVRRALLDPSGHELVAGETLRAEWEQVNASTGKLVVIQQLEGVGHGWPGGRGTPPFLSGHIPKDVDATGLVLDFARRVVDAGVTDS